MNRLRGWRLVVGEKFRRTVRDQIEHDRQLIALLSEAERRQLAREFFAAVSAPREDRRGEVF